ncbi:MAG: methylated-DNA--[protein]-cysteine S-methyltransferase [Stagnimonas sp.]|nr:methylated-DNA--[protein]-cysteine S-methyltransferase [Stagnimonas sp.]
MTTHFSSMSSPVGELTFTGTADGLTGVWFDTDRHQHDRTHWQRDDALFADTRQQLEEYFVGARQVFDLKLAVQGTVFQQQVWAALCAIPFGETRSYGQQARSMDNEKAVRAVGLANGKNPISIIVPCHRVIGANGALTGYAGGLERKQWLLAHEAKIAGTRWL